MGNLAISASAPWLTGPVALLVWMNFGMVSQLWYARRDQKLEEIVQLAMASHASGAEAHLNAGPRHVVQGAAGVAPAPVALAVIRTSARAAIGAGCGAAPALQRQSSERLHDLACDLDHGGCSTGGSASRELIYDRPFWGRQETALKRGGTLASRVSVWGGVAADV